MDDSCSICQDTFSEPKGLPCFHTFCQDCLQQYINNDTGDKSFSCPLCRRKTQPINPLLPKRDWAKSFPTNIYVMKLQTVWKLCPTHNNETMTINCKTCQVMICYQCCLSNHETCEKIITEANAEKIKNHFVLKKDSLKAKLEPVDKRLSNIQNCISTTEKQINQTSDELIKFIRGQEKYWIEDVGKYSEVSDELEKEKKGIIEILEKLQENIDELDNLVDQKDTDSRAKSLVTFDYNPKHILIEGINGLLKLKFDYINYQINPNFQKIKEEILKTDMMEMFTSPHTNVLVGKN